MISQWKRMEEMENERKRDGKRVDKRGRKRGTDWGKHGDRREKKGCLIEKGEEKRNRREVKREDKMRNEKRRGKSGKEWL